MLEAIVLAVAAVVFLGFAILGLFRPRMILEPLGGHVETPSVANEIRANYGGMQLGIAVLLALGAARPGLRVHALALLFTFTAGLCLGRLVSRFADGSPNRFVRMFFALEAAGALVSGALLLRGT